MIDTVVGELREQGYLDDARYARRFAEDRRRLDDWGAERIERRLLALGVDRELMCRRGRSQDADDELDGGRRAARRRFPDTAGDAARAASGRCGVLVRKGYDLELAHDALRRHAGAPRSTEPGRRRDVAADCGTPSPVLRSAQRQTGRPGP